MSKKSAGLVVYRELPAGIEVFLIHPGGPFWAKRDNGAWSIPKGEFLEEEPLEAAKREFYEETGFTVNGEFIPLSPLRQPSGKIIYAWAVRGNIDTNAVRSNMFSLEWPRGSGNFHQFPEVDKAFWFPFEVAKRKIRKGQIEFLIQLMNVVAREKQPKL